MIKRKKTLFSENDTYYFVSCGDCYYDMDDILTPIEDEANSFGSISEARKYAKELVKKGYEVTHITKSVLKKNYQQYFYSL